MKRIENNQIIMIRKIPNNGNKNSYIIYDWLNTKIVKTTFYKNYEPCDFIKELNSFILHNEYGCISVNKIDENTYLIILENTSEQIQKIKDFFI